MSKTMQVTFLTKVVPLGPLASEKKIVTPVGMALIYWDIKNSL
jgi:hypothetical protein